MDTKNTIPLQLAACRRVNTEFVEQIAHLYKTIDELGEASSSATHVLAACCKDNGHHVELIDTLRTTNDKLEEALSWALKHGVSGRIESTVAARTKYTAGDAYYGSAIKPPKHLVNTLATAIRRTP